jgi:hypothetical protein
MVMKIYWVETYWLQKNNENQLVSTVKNGYKVNTEKPELMFISCEEYVEDCHNIKISNSSFCVVITQK